jgi:hypothetical protein
MVVKILADEEHHLREFKGFLKEYEGPAAAARPAAPVSAAAGVRH